MGGVVLTIVRGVVHYRLFGQSSCLAEKFE